MAEKRCYTVKELQEILGVSRPTVYNLLKKNEFRWIQLDGGIYMLKLDFHARVADMVTGRAKIEAEKERKLLEAEEMLMKKAVQKHDDGVLLPDLPDEEE